MERSDVGYQPSMTGMVSDRLFDWAKAGRFEVPLTSGCSKVPSEKRRTNFGETGWLGDRKTLP